jgi:hypothetical protein
MSKRFDIHEWQAKQRQQLLKENFANQKYYDLLNDLRDEGHLHRYGVTQLQMQFGLKEKEAQEIYNQYKEDLKAEQPDAYDFYMKDLNEALNPEVSQKVNAFIKAMAQRYDYSEQDAVFAIMAALKQRDFDGVNEHHAGDYNPGFLKQSVSTFLDKLKKKTDEGPDYETVEKIMEKYFSAKKKNEASMTGTGASFTPGTGAGYATPKAFGDNKNKKKKGYMGYKEI